LDENLKIFILKDNDFQYSNNIRKRPVPILQYLNSLSKDSNPYYVSLTKNVEDANYILFPYNLQSILGFYGYADSVKLLHSLPYFKEFEDKYIFFLDHDSSIPFHLKSLIFRTNVDSHSKDIGAISVPYVVNDLFDKTHFYLKECKYDVSFVGYIGSSKIRFSLLSNILQTKQTIRKYIKVRSKFHGDLDAKTREQNKTLFYESMRDSILVLCPAGAGKNTIRLYEIMSMGRIPVLVSDEWILPFEDEIDYDDFVLRVKEDQADIADEIITNWFKSQSYDELLRKCKKNREIWQKYFSINGYISQIFKILARYKPASEVLTTTNHQTIDYQQLRSIVKNNFLQELQNNNYASAATYLELLFNKETLRNDLDTTQEYLECLINIRPKLDSYIKEKCEEIIRLQSQE